MRTGRPAAALVIVVVTFTALVLSTSSPSAPTPNPPGTFAFGALGDAPYYPWEDCAIPSCSRTWTVTTSRFPFHD